jgi:hypothetical protein
MREANREKSSREKKSAIIFSWLVSRIAETLAWL